MRRTSATIAALILISLSLAGTADHDLVDMENLAFLNQVARIDCSTDCSELLLIDLEPLPPDNPLPGTELATPFGIQVSDDDTTIVSVAAASSRLFTLDAETGDTLGVAEVGAIPRGLALVSDGDGAPLEAWVYNLGSDTPGGLLSNEVLVIVP